MCWCLERMSRRASVCGEAASGVAATGPPELEKAGPVPWPVATGAFDETLRASLHRGLPRLDEVAGFSATLETPTAQPEMCTPGF